MNIFFEYIKYRWNAKAQHGIHSPFVFNLMKDTFNVVPSPKEKTLITHFASKQNTNRKAINIEDHGAKSKRLRENRSIKQIFKTSSSHGKYGILMYKICKYFKPKNILELGTSIGMGSLYMQLGAPNCDIISIEGCPETYATAKENLKNYPIRLINETFENAIKGFKKEKFDLVFIDGHHDGVALQNYIEALGAFTDENTLFVLDDIRWSDSMLDSWNELKSSSTYHLTMDFFRMGILVKRPNQVKEHFTLKLRR